MAEEVVVDKAKGELRILGQRNMALNVEALCKHLDALVGQSVAEVIIRNHEFRLGKEDAERRRKEKASASTEEIIEYFKQNDAVSGAGVTKCTVHPDKSALVEISNPCVKETTGAAKSLLFGYWCGVLSQLFGKDYDTAQVHFNEPKHTLSALLVPRG